MTFPYLSFKCLRNPYTRVDYSKYDISAHDSSETKYADLKICYHKVLLDVSKNVFL